MFLVKRTNCIVAAKSTTPILHNVFLGCSKMTLEKFLIRVCVVLGIIVMILWAYESGGFIHVIGKWFGA